MSSAKPRKKSVKSPKKRGPGRPATGKDPFIGLRMPPELTAQIDVWAERNAINRSEAIRRLVDKALACQESA
jgi:hypothetical protein